MNISPDDLKTIARVKRFFERFHGDAVFRRRFSENPATAIRDYRLGIDPLDVRHLWEARTENLEEAESSPMSPAVELYRDFILGRREEPRRWCGERLAGNERYLGWRNRQKARCGFELGERKNSGIVHSPATFELSKGCFVGCWFCAISAESFAGNFEYSPENARLWRDILQALKEILGPVSSLSFCYWATDPFDNPDYEKLLLDFHKIMGTIPQTTTAQPLRDLERTRRQLRRAEALGYQIDQFSIITDRMPDKVHEAFSPEELLSAEMVLVNKGSLMPKTDAGGARNRRLGKKGKPGILRMEKGELANGTIACVSGFLFNLVERSIRLISPCYADNRWPLDYRIHDEATFGIGGDVPAILEEMIERHMPAAPQRDGRLAFHRLAVYERFLDGFQLSSAFHRQTARRSPFTGALGDMIHAGDKTYAEVVAAMEAMGAPDVDHRGLIQKLFEKGLLDDEPRPRRAFDVPVEAVAVLSPSV
ncbi:MAG: radical SAM family RiPP maturation amino acid epimerase [Nitrospinota bacterium]|nr:radical SAM family RiPP maturation amino acid epimerase [Nitrospinota bacterium]